MPIAVGLFLGVVITFVNVLRSMDARAFYLGLDGLRSWIFVALGVIATSLICLLWFRPKLRTLLISTALLVVGVFAFTKLVRVESFYGNMVPRLAWSWTPTAEERVEAYFVSRKPLGANKLDPTSPTSAPTVFQPTEYDFAEFLGPQRNGLLTSVTLDGDWTARPPKLLWKHPVGLGWSSFAVVGRAAVNLEQRGDDECIVCYDARTGDQLWVHTERVRFVDEHGDGPRSTPTIVNGCVFSMGANGTLTCLDLESGQLIWKQNVLRSEEDNLLWGMSGSPLHHEGKIYVTPGGKSSSVVCYSANDGTELWRGGDDPGAYASPIMVNAFGEPQLLSFNGAGLRAFNPKDGNPLWLFPWLTQGEMQRVNVAQPIVLPNPTDDAAEHGFRVLVSSGYGNGTALVQINNSGDTWNAQTLWTSTRLKSKMSNFVVSENHIYGLDSGILTCISLEDGSRLWKQGRYGHGQMLLVNDLLLIQAETGEVAIVRASPTAFRELSKFQALDGKTWNNLALAGNLLMVRNDHEAAAYELP
ncbi:MAG: PQQ-like beta-propeller repeat protein, partial [bacterium]|nr:PQQ-like beta-propeller repeat protein [bacterium]